jgi:hypothetical protein
MGKLEVHSKCGSENFKGKDCLRNLEVGDIKYEIDDAV